MSDYLKICGIPIPCTASEHQPVRLGEYSRALNGAPRSSVRAEKQELRFTTDEMFLEEARPLRALIQGVGHAWSFDGAEMISSRGLLPSEVSNVAGVELVSSGTYGGGLSIPHEEYVEWNAQLGNEWTALVFRTTSGVTNYHQVIRQRPDAGAGDVDVWENGVNNPGANVDLVTVMSGYLRLTATEEATVFDDLVVFPFAIPDAWAPLLYAFHSAQAWPSLPYVKAEGEAVEASGLACVGEAGTGRRVPKRRPDNTLTTGELFDFTLHGT